MKQKISRLSLLIVAAFTAAAVSAPLTFAQSTTITVSVSSPVIDVCPNIPGVQATVPSGMVINGSGDCVTPPPPVVDVCANIPGIQPTIPPGFYQDSSGNCLPQPTPPIDVCPNLFGVQATVPSSLIVDENGNCIAPPIDECPNIDGPQSAVPTGMIKIDSVCFTPTPPTEEPDEEDEAPIITGVGGTRYKNVPEILTPLVEPLVNAVPEPVKEFAKSVSPTVARTVPYYIYALLAVGSVLMVVQAIREVAATKYLIGLLKRERNIAEQKDNFIALASHYLRTPLTLMRNGLDTIAALKELPNADLAPLRTPIERMDENIREIIADIENNEALKNISAPRDADIRRKSVLASGFFWGSMLGSLALTLAANFLLGVVADVDLGTANLLFQIVVITAVSILFYTALRNHHIAKYHRARQQILMDHEYTVDLARNQFITRSTNVLQQGLEEIYAHRDLLKDAPSAKFFDDGYNRFNNILEKFLLLSTLQANAPSASTKIHLRELADNVIRDYSALADSHNITINNEISDSLHVTQNPELLTFVLKTVIDNAIKFNTDGGTVTVVANGTSKHITVNIKDSGIGIPQDKLSQLFKPFSRADSALRFTYEGLGFSLFLDKIITEYIGGDITATSKKDSGTDITLKLVPAAT